MSPYVWLETMRSAPPAPSARHPRSRTSRPFQKSHGKLTQDLTRLGPGCSKMGIVGHRFQMIFEVQNLQTLSASKFHKFCVWLIWGGPVFNALNVAFSLSEMQMKKPWQNHQRNLRRGTPTYGFPSAGSNKNRSKRSDNSAQKSES